MTVYTRVPHLEPGMCTGCAVNHNASTEENTPAGQQCIILNKQSGNNCARSVWIEDTEAGRLAYITLKLEN
jgi:hypothetical protein